MNGEWWIHKKSACLPSNIFRMHLKTFGYHLYGQGTVETQATNSSQLEAFGKSQPKSFFEDLYLVA